MIFLEQLGAGDVARHQVGRELHAREAQVERLRDRLHEQRLREAGHADEQDVTAGEQRGDEIVDDLVLADDAAADLLDERRAARANWSSSSTSRESSIGCFRVATRGAPD